MKYLPSTKQKRALAVLLGLIIVLICVSVIFIMSSFDGYKSNVISIRIVGFIKEEISLLQKLNENQFIENINFNIVLRKVAHFTEYFILYTVVFIALSFTKLNDKKKKLIPLFVTILFAASDEIHQTFVIARTPLVTDFIIDVLGALTAMKFVSIFKRRVKKTCN